MSDINPWKPPVHTPRPSLEQFCGSSVASSQALYLTTENDEVGLPCKHNMADQGLHLADAIKLRTVIGIQAMRRQARLP